MKIIFPFSGTRFGGSNISSMILINNLINKNFTPEIIIHQKGQFSKYLDDNFIKYKLINKENYNSDYNKFKNITIILKFLLFGIKYLFENKKIIIHLNEYRIAYTWIIPLLFFKTPVIIHGRNLYYKSFFLNLICKRSNKIITISDFVLNSFPKKFSFKLLKINNPIIFDNNKIISREKFFLKYKLKSTKKTICYISNFKHKKRPLLFIDIAKKILKLRTDVQFLMFGNYNSIYKNKIIKKIKDNNLISKINFYPFQADIYNIISNSEVIVLTGVNEGLGRIALESFYYKTFVVAAKSGGYNETIIDKYNGYLCDIDNADDFANKIHTYLDLHKNLKKNLINNAYEYVNKNFKSSDHVNKIINIYKGFKNV